MTRLLCSAMVIALMVCPALADAPVAVSGKVTLDAKPLAGVRVTDGVNFAVSAADGSYSLTIADDYMIPYRPARTVSVCWPSNTWPAGKWWYRLSEVTDAKAVNFALRADEQKLPFVFLHISDDHGSGKMLSEHYTHDAAAAKPHAKFIFNTGDMGYATPQGAEEMFRSIDGHAKAFPLPMFFSPGNHDFVGEDEKTKMTSHPLAGWGAYTKYCGPTRWSFDYAGVHFVSIDYMEKVAPPKNYTDMIPKIGVQFLEKDLAAMPKDRRVVLLVHCYDAPAEFFRALHKYRVDQVCAGHTHVPLFAKLAGVPSFTNYGIANGIVTETAIDMVERRPMTYGNSSLLGYFKSVTAAAMEKRRLKQLVAQPFQAVETQAGKPVPLTAAAGLDSCEIVVQIDPLSARKVGLRVGEKDAIEITFDGAAVSVAGAPVPFKLASGDKLPPMKIAPSKTLEWHILIDKDRLSILGNNLYRMTKPVKVDQPGKVSVLAEGGKAAFKKVEVWELKTIANPASRGLHHFAPPAWTWGVSQHTQAALDDKSPTAAEILKRYNEEGVVNYDAE
ncbi:MAG: metallophosphoesterase [Planctomycetaceae bacterium]|nr:metallophosphoesterase [Planctomycetaceae bacterium]